MSVWFDDMMKLGSVYIKQYDEFPVRTLKMLCNTTVPMQILCTLYNYLARDNEITKLEDLPFDEKQLAWYFAISYADEDKVKAHNLCKAMAVMKSVLQKECISEPQNEPDPF